MCANAQRDGRPAEYRWRPLLKPQSLLSPTTRVPCSNAAKTQWCPKLANRSQPLVGRSSPYYEDIWRMCQRLTIFSDCLSYLSCEDTVRQSCAMAPKWRFLRPVFSANRVPHISDMHSKSALRPHHVCKYGRHPISDAEIRRGKNN